MQIIVQMIRLAALLVLISLVVGAPQTTRSDLEAETLAVFADDCATVKTMFSLGEGVCAVASGSPIGAPPQRGFEWISPDGTICQIGPEVVSDPQANSISIPSSGSFAQVGTWTVK